MKSRNLKTELDSIMEATAASQAFVSANLGGDSGGIPAELQEPEPLFTVDFDKIKGDMESDARQTLEFMLGAVMPITYVSNPYVQHQLKVDAKALMSVYYQRELLILMEETGIKSLAAGNISPRMIEVVNMTAENTTKQAKIITEMLAAMRKNYIDIMLDIQQRENAEKQAFAELGVKPEKRIEEKKIFVGSKEVVQNLKQRKIDAGKARQEMAEK